MAREHLWARDTRVGKNLPLTHDGKELRDRCNNYNAAEDMNKPVLCKLRAGDVIKCQAFADRMLDEAGGYDLIWRDDREQGNSLPGDKNELLRISDYDAAYKAKRMAELAKLSKVPLTIMYESFWGILSVIGMFRQSVLAA